MGIRYSEKAGAWAVHNARGLQCGEASTEELARLYEAAPALLVALQEAVILLELLEPATPFSGAAARLSEVIERAT